MRTPRYYNVHRNDDALERYRNQVYRCYDVLEGQLVRSGGESILPSGISSVDCHYQPWVKPAEYAGVSLDNYPHIRKWLAVMDQEQAVQDAYQKIKDATAEQDPAAAKRGLKPDENLLRDTKAKAERS